MTTADAAHWRSLLFVPADRPAFLARAAERGADALILDLEDSVAPQRKDEARRLAAAAVSELAARGADVLVRINDDPRTAAADVDAVVGAGLCAIVVPKAECSASLAELCEQLRDKAGERGLSAHDIGVIAQIESPRGLAAMDAIAAVDGVTALALGPEDLAASSGMAALPHTLQGPAQALVFAARRHGCVAIGYPDSIGNYTDTARLAAAVTLGRELGFRGAMAIHPAQVPILNEHFLPTPEEVAFALAVEAALGAAEGDTDAANTLGAIAVAGRMVDRPVAQLALENLARARRFGVPLPTLAAEGGAAP